MNPYHHSHPGNRYSYAREFILTVDSIDNVSVFRPEKKTFFSHKTMNFGQSELSPKGSFFSFFTACVRASSTLVEEGLYRKFQTISFAKTSCVHLSYADLLIPCFITLVLKAGVGAKAPLTQVHAQHSPGEKLQATAIKLHRR